VEATSPNRVRVGAFEFDLKAGELRSGDQKVRLQEQPFQILLMLVQGSGGLVSREEIQKKLWPNDTVVEFDHSIHTAIKKLRRALGDSAENPKYIETVARRGYRLMVLVERAETSPDNLPLDAGSASPPVLESAASSLTGKKVSDYRVLEVLGGGGMGVVYKAEDLKLGRLVALKFLPEELGSNAKVLERFEREARAASALDHPNICAIHEFGEHEGRPFIAMSLLEGQNLRDRMAARADPFATDELLNLAIQIGDGLAAAHEKGIVHRDIKPANIFITNRSEAKILDFGLAKLTYAGDCGDHAHEETQTATVPDLSLSLTGVAMGTVPYMSPEQVRGEKLDARSDLFSFGLVLYEMATGKQAFRGDTVAALHEAILHDAPVAARELNPELPPELEKIIGRALEKDRNLRYQQAADMRTDLQRLRQDFESGHTTAASSGPLASLGAPAAPRIELWKIAVPVLLVALLVAGGLYYRSHQSRRLSEKDTIVVADFDNRTGDPAFDDTLKDALAVDLDQSPYLNVVSDQKIIAALKLMGRAPGQRLTGGVARELCQRLSSSAMLQGSIANLGNQYLVVLTATNCATGDLLASEQVRAGSKEKILPVVDEAASSLRGRLGESLGSIGKYATPVEQATTPSLAALQAYSEGVKVWGTKGNQAAMPFYKRAIELDPNFAMAYAHLGQAYANLDVQDLAIENLNKAFNLRDRVSERERFYIDSHYYDIVTGELEKEVRVLEEWRQVYPREWMPARNLVLRYRELGRNEDALREAREGVRLEPVEGSYYELVFSALRLNRLDEAQAALNEWQTRNPDSVLQVWDRYLLAFLRNDPVGMQKQSARGMGPDWNSTFLRGQSDTAAYYGCIRKARELTRRAMEWEISDNEVAGRRAADFEIDGALHEAVLGYSKQAQRATSSMNLSEGDASIEARAALALALARDARRAETITAELAKRPPLDTLFNLYWLPTIEAAIQLSRGNPAKAVQGLEVTSRYELAGVLHDSTAPLFPVYVRGQAFLALHQGREAAGEFQKYIDHPGIVMNYPLGALARVGLARAYTMQGDTVKARAAYQDFFSLWKDADPDVPILKQAKAEYAKLQ